MASNTTSPMVQRVCTILKAVLSLTVLATALYFIIVDATYRYYAVLFLVFVVVCYFQLWQYSPCDRARVKEITAAAVSEAVAGRQGGLLRGGGTVAVPMLCTPPSARHPLQQQQQSSFYIAASPTASHRHPHHREPSFVMAHSPSPRRRSFYTSRPSSPYSSSETGDGGNGGSRVVPLPSTPPPRATTPAQHQQSLSYSHEPSFVMARSPSPRRRLCYSSHPSSPCSSSVFYNNHNGAVEEESGDSHFLPPVATLPSAPRRPHHPTAPSTRQQHEMWRGPTPPPSPRQQQVRRG